MPKLDRRAIGTLPGPDYGRFDIVHWDTDMSGLGLRVLKSGSRSWVVRYRVGKRQRVITLGKIAVLSPAQARAKAGEILAKARLGQDSQAEILTEKASAGSLLGDLVTNYIEQHVERVQRPRTQIETKRHLLKHWKPFHRIAIADVTHQMVAEHLGKLERRSGPVARNRARSSLSRLFSWAMQEGFSDQNPVGDTAKRPERARERILSRDELSAIWHATDEPGDHNAIVRLLLLTGQRRQEVGGMGRQEVDLEKAIWVIPSERTKNRRAHEVPLSPLAVEVLIALVEGTDRAFVFGLGDGPFSGWSRAKARLDRKCGVENWTLHDLRRTFVTELAEMGVMPHVIEAIVNHTSGHKAGIAGVYNRATYAGEKRAALDQWSEEIGQMSG